MKRVLTAMLLLVALTATAVMAETPAAIEAPALEGPYIVTTCGQSPGGVMLSMSAMQAGIQATTNNALTAADLAGGEYKTLIVTTGTSMKGMGAAGTNVEAEIARCVEVINAAKEAGMVVVGAHIEGMARRVDSSDEASIQAVMELADVLLVIEDSDGDGYFTTYAAEHQKPLLKVKDALAAGSVLK